MYIAYRHSDTHLQCYQTHRLNMYNVHSYVCRHQHSIILDWNTPLLKINRNDYDCKSSDLCQLFEIAQDRQLS